MAYRFLEHTADALVECRAEDFEKLLETAANALYAIAFETTQTRAEVEQVIQAEAEDDAALLVAWLQELIYLMEVKYFVASVFSFQEAAPTSVSATLLGYVYAPGERDAEVKAATYHGAEVRRENDELVAQVLFDL